MKISACTAEKGARIWTHLRDDIKDTIHYLPPFLERKAIVFRLPYDMPKASSNLFIKTKYPANVYICYYEKHSKTLSNSGWSKETLDKMGFKRESRGEVKIDHHIHKLIPLITFRKVLDEQEFVFKEMESEKTQVLLMIEEGNHIVILVLMSFL